MGEYTESLFFVLFVAGIVFVCVGVLSAYPVPATLGDNVTTTDRYTEVFNDTFAGHVIVKDDGVCTVRGPDGIEREFDEYWLAKVE